MKIFISLLFVSSIFLLYGKEINSAKLRSLAKISGLKAVPINYKELLKRIDNPKNHMSVAKINLGRTLFFEPLLSKNKSLTCASCHKMGEGGDDNLPTAIGFKKRVNPKHLNSPTVLNAALSKFFFWDGRAKSLEEQTAGPLQAHFEMNLTPKEVVRRLSVSKMYQEAFKEAFDGKITFENVQKAIAAYERTLLTKGKFDDFLNGNNKALNLEEKQGLRLFIKKGCAKCHFGIALGGQSIEKFPKYGDIFPFKNTGGFKGKDDKYLFRVPILRNITKTAPYYHNGTIKSLRKVIDIESKNETGQKLTKKQIEFIIKFLKTLDGEIIDYKING